MAGRKRTGYPWWVVLILALVSFSGAVAAYYDLTEFEIEGGERWMPWLGVLIYKWFGKWGVVGACVLSGVLLVRYMFRQLAKLKRQRQCDSVAHEKNQADSGIG